MNVTRRVPAGTDHVYPRNTNKNLETYLKNVLPSMVVTPE